MIESKQLDVVKCGYDQIESWLTCMGAFLEMLGIGDYHNDGRAFIMVELYSMCEVMRSRQRYAQKRILK
jgi:hypothetical protein